MDFEFDDLTAQAPAPSEEQAPTAFTPITMEELIAPTNTLAVSAQPYVAAAIRHIQETIQAREDSQEFTEALDRARREGENFQEKQREVNDLVTGWLRSQSGMVTPEQLRWVRARVNDFFLAEGPLAPLLRDKRVTEVLVTHAQPHIAPGPTGETYTGGTRVEVAGLGLVDAPSVLFNDDEEVLQLAQFLMPDNPPNISEPTRSATLGSGARIEAAHPCVTDGNTFLAIRRHPESAWTMSDLIEVGTVSEELARDLAGYVRRRLNLVVSGGTGSGKTSLLNALVRFIDPTFHVAIIEDTKEMKTPDYLFTSRRVARPARGAVDAVSIRSHIRAALRSRPDIILVGEVRGVEALDAMKAMNTGHEGSMTTCHSNSAHDTVLRLETMISESQEVSESAATHSIAASCDVIIFQSRMPDKSRKVTGVYEVTKPSLDDTQRVPFVELKPLWLYENGEWVRKGSLSAETLRIRAVAGTKPDVTNEEIETLSAL